MCSRRIAKAKSFAILLLNGVKVREQHRSPDGKLYEKMEKTGLPFTPADLEILQRMGVSKK
jgi:hypothetical protein